ncbi:uncharacterized protein EI90DRAFT_2263009 [Cantharellus anzutake]|uniref:uncharacterized protein n=1 Tax=Cantharellus anzutake TaxID=1750568 RepID=UPI0019068DA2|nr:uncharacterized protein EI90DRAFT_2263009 [Cantharellus anzutake]KAF8339645.1 hypothetical protein EI90DRAFT_2263009 [Cantharellus anzutake]
MTTLNEADSCSDYDPLFDGSDASEHGDAPNQSGSHGSFSPGDAAGGKSLAGGIAPAFHSTLALPTSSDVKTVQGTVLTRSVKNVGTIALPVSLTNRAEHKFSPSSISASISGTPDVSSWKTSLRKRGRGQQVDSMPSAVMSKAPSASPIPLTALRPGTCHTGVYSTQRQFAPPPVKRPRVEYRPPTPADTSSYEGQVLAKFMTDPSCITTVRAYIHLLADLIPSWKITTNPPFSITWKARRIPAGASAWDIPFPFAPGQAPKGYIQKWYGNRRAVLLEDIKQAVKHVVFKAETARQAEIQLDALAGWGEDANDQVRLSRVANAIHRGLRKMLQRQVEFMAIDLEQLPDLPGNSSGVTPHLLLTESPLDLPAVEEVVGQCISQVCQGTSNTDTLSIHLSPPVGELPSLTDPAEASSTTNLSQVDAFGGTNEASSSSPSFLPTPSSSLSPSISDNGHDLPSILSNLTVPDSMIDPSLLDTASCQDMLDEAADASEPTVPDFDLDVLERFIAQFGSNDGITPTPPESPEIPVPSVPSPVTASQPPRPSKRKSRPAPRARAKPRAARSPASTGASTTATVSKNQIVVSEVCKRAQETRERVRNQLQSVERQMKELAVEERVLLHLVRGLAAKENVVPTTS